MLCFLAFLHVPLRQDCVFSLPRPGDGRFHSAGAQRDPAFPLSALLVPSVSSPYPDTNAGIGLRATKSSDSLTLQLFQTNQMWGGETIEATSGATLSESCWSQPLARRQ